jgi:hypothetical protein
MAKAKPAKSARSPLPWVGVVLFLVSWLVPVFQGQQLFGPMGEVAKSVGTKPEPVVWPSDGPDWLPGWTACRISWLLLTEAPRQSHDDWKRIVGGSSCLTNLALVFALVAMACGSRPRVLGLLLLACAVVDASWLYLNTADVVRALRPGYYLWLASFVVTGIGLLLPGGGRRK